MGSNTRIIGEGRMQFWSIPKPDGKVSHTAVNATFVLNRTLYHPPLFPPSTPHPLPSLTLKIYLVLLILCIYLILALPLFILVFAYMNIYIYKYH